MSEAVQKRMEAWAALLCYGAYISRGDLSGRCARQAMRNVRTARGREGAKRARNHYEIMTKTLDILQIFVYTRIVKKSAEEASDMTCPVCNREIPAGSNICPQCGADLTKLRPARSARPMQERPVQERPMAVRPGVRPCSSTRRR